MKSAKGTQPNQSFNTLADWNAILKDYLQRVFDPELSVPLRGEGAKDINQEARRLGCMTARRLEGSDGKQVLVVLHEIIGSAVRARLFYRGLFKLLNPFE